MSWIVFTMTETILQVCGSKWENTTVVATWVLNVSAILGIELKMSDYVKTLFTLNTIFNLHQQF